MNWTALGAIGELFGGVAVLVTLIYLAIQVRNGGKELRKNSQLIRQQWLRELHMERVRNPALREVRRKLNADFGQKNDFVETLLSQTSLSHDEAQLVLAEYQALYVYRTEMIENIGDLSPYQRADFDRMLLADYSTGAGKIWIEQIRDDEHRLVKYLADLRSDAEQRDA
ncbi:MAG: hypothetical protein ACFHX7_18480 [Pseudomonadota bacterium]